MEKVVTEDGARTLPATLLPYDLRYAFPMDSGLLCEDFPGAKNLIERLCSAVQLGDVHKTADAVRTTLTELLGQGAVRLPDKFFRAVPDHYARRLLYRCPDGSFTAVVMTWGPGQRTPLHDHAGIWCVEGVVSGTMLVERYELCDKSREEFRFEKVEELTAGVGDSGALIPPYEYHILGNPSSEATSVTLHIYGGEMDRCSIFEPAEQPGWYRRIEKSLAYTLD